MIEEVDSKFYIRISGSANSATNKFLVPNDKETIYIKKKTHIAVYTQIFKAESLKTIR